MTRDKLISVLVGASGSGHARRLLRIWPLWERIAHRIWPAVEVPGATYHLFGLRFRQHSGDPVSLPGGVVIRPGAWLGELHLVNASFVDAFSGYGGPQPGFRKWAVLPMFRTELQAIAAWLESGTMPQPIEAITGVTILGRGAVRLGFTMLPRKGRLMSYLDKLFVDGLLIIYTPEGAQRMTVGKTAGDASQEAWLSTTELLTRYGSRSSDSLRREGPI